MSGGKTAIGEPLTAGRSFDKFAVYAFHRIWSENIWDGCLLKAESQDGNPHKAASQFLSSRLAMLCLC